MAEIRPELIKGKANKSAEPTNETKEEKKGRRKGRKLLIRLNRSIKQKGLRVLSSIDEMSTMFKQISKILEHENLKQVSMKKPNSILKFSEEFLEKKMNFPAYAIKKAIRAMKLSTGLKI